ncbi:hypothetical protein SDC9_169090 [bioreactor metagenome]|uniref:Uncharacterized protein n=1 Tax=bioreactor metagenome TaxID=1076179 RepID=A0A645G6W8_9ZZZZ
MVSYNAKPPNKERVRGYNRVTAIPIKNTVMAARYFPTTTPDTDTGEVKRSCSVLIFFSSANSRMVSIGDINMTRIRMLEKKTLMSLLWFPRLIMEKQYPQIKRKKPKNIYPTMELKYCVSSF